MKTKLLKRIRRKYSIYHVIGDCLERYDDWTQTEYMIRGVDEYISDYYQVNEKLLLLFTDTFKFKSYEDAINFILEEVRKDYSHIKSDKRNSNIKIKKVWYNEK